MKSILFFFLIFIFTTTLNAQLIYEDSNTKRVGINMNIEEQQKPKAPLHIAGGNHSWPWGSIYLAPENWNNSGGISMESSFSGKRQRWFMGPGGGAGHNNFRIWVFKGAYPGGNKFVVTTQGDVGIGSTGSIYPKTLAKAVMRVKSTGSVEIGNADMKVNSNYGLFVEKGILTSKLKVAIKNSTEWADYVFEEDYQLRSLEEVDKFIQDNKHLPGLPSAEEVAEAGIDVAKMDAKLLEKIEELTLYMIDLKKENEQLKTAIEALQSN